MDDIWGSVESRTYKNEPFGFQLTSGIGEYLFDINTQEGYKESFNVPSSFSNFSVMYYSSAQSEAQIIFYVSRLDSLSRKTAKEQLEYEKYGVTSNDVILGDKNFNMITVDDETKIKSYSKIVGKHYIKWVVSSPIMSELYKLDQILNSIYFSWTE